MKHRLLDLFSGIGGFSLGLERSGGFETVAFCEIEDYPRRVLAKHWPEVPIYDDVRTLSADRLAADGITVDAICGGFPCQDISLAGKGAGIEGARSGLWSEYARLIGEIRPQFVIVENVAALLGRGFERVLGDLASLGYDAEWDCISAADIGSIHGRERVWIVAYPVSARRTRLVTSAHFSAPGSRRVCRQADLQAIASAPFEPGNRWPKPLIRRVDDGLPGRVDRLKGLGNAVVPQIPEIIGRAIMEADRRAA